jgi:hypothetical protein
MAKTRNNRTPESEMRIAALLVARSKPNGFASTTEVKAEVGNYITITPQDRAISKTRSGEPLYYQIVGNVVCHQGSSRSPFSRGFAIRRADGLEITQKGRDYLTSLGH